MPLLSSVIEQLNNGIVPTIPENIDFISLIEFYKDQTDATTSDLFLLGIENYFKKHPLPSEVQGFDHFFSSCQLFDRNKNLINRFMDAVTGIRSMANNIKFNQVLEEKGNPGDLESMRVRGSFEYSHTQCHYSLLLDIFNYIRPSQNELLIDVGSGFGRVGHFLGLCFPDTKYIGYEIVDQRVQCANDIAAKNKLNHLEFHTQDILAPEFALPNGQYYFLYDPLDKEGLTKFTDRLYKQFQMNQKDFRIIALSGYDEYILEHFSNLDWLLAEKNLKDEYFKNSGVIYKTSKLLNL